MWKTNIRPEHMESATAVVERAGGRIKRKGEKWAGWDLIEIDGISKRRFGPELVKEVRRRKNAVEYNYGAKRRAFGASGGGPQGPERT